MKETPTCVRILMTRSRGYDDDHRPQSYAGPATVLTGLPRMVSTIFEMEKRGEFPPRFNLSPRCVVWNLAEVG